MDFDRIASDKHISCKRRKRPKKNREIYCPAHSEQLVEGNGKKYFLHLLTAEELTKRGFSAKKSRLLINAYPVYVVSDEWIEELYCPKCNCNRWFHIKRIDHKSFIAHWAKRELWKQVAHVDPIRSNPSVSQYSLNQAGRFRRKNNNNKMFYDP